MPRSKYDDLRDLLGGQDLFQKSQGETDQYLSEFLGLGGGEAPGASLPTNWFDRHEARTGNKIVYGVPPSAPGAETVGTEESSTLSDLTPLLVSLGLSVLTSRMGLGPGVGAGIGAVGKGSRAYRAGQAVRKGLGKLTGGRLGGGPAAKTAAPAVADVGKKAVENAVKGGGWGSKFTKVLGVAGLGSLVAEPIVGGLQDTIARVSGSPTRAERQEEERLNMEIAALSRKRGAEQALAEEELKFRKELVTAEREMVKERAHQEMLMRLTEIAEQNRRGRVEGLMNIEQAIVNSRVQHMDSLRDIMTGWAR
jgi:hypothetical protein